MLTSRHRDVISIFEDEPFMFFSFERSNEMHIDEMGFVGADENILAELLFKFAEDLGDGECFSIGKEELAVIALGFNANEMIDVDDIDPAGGSDHHFKWGGDCS